MKTKRWIALCLAIILAGLLCVPAYAENTDEDSAIAADFGCKFGDVQIKLEPGFDFINTDSQYFDYNLALTGAVLSQAMYTDEYSAGSIMCDIGYNYYHHYQEYGFGEYQNAAITFGYKELTDKNGNTKNIFAISVRGSASVMDWITDTHDGLTSMFADTAENAVENFKKFLKDDRVNKTESQLKEEDTYFFITGHSLGAAVANCLSANEYITSLANENKGRIYTYTFESPHTCINLWWMDVAGASNAHNFKNIDDLVTHIPSYIGSTTYGKDEEFSVAKLNYEIFDTLFPNAEGDSFDALGGVAENLHDAALDLVYIIQDGIADGYWDSVDDVIADESDKTQTAEVLNIETGEFEELTFDTDDVMQWDDFVAAYPDVVCILKLSGEEFEEYTESMWIYEFQLRDSDGNLLERAGAFNITGYDGTDPIGWGETYGPITYQSSDGYDSYTYYIRYQDTIVMGPASIEINTYTAPTPDEDNVLFNTIVTGFQAENYAGDWVWYGEGDLTGTLSLQADSNYTLTGSLIFYRLFRDELVITSDANGYADVTSELGNFTGTAFFGEDEINISFDDKQVYGNSTISEMLGTSNFVFVAEDTVVPAAPK